MANENTLYFHRTDRDRQPARRVVTGQLLGDPAPDREERAERLRQAIPTGRKGLTVDRRKYDY